MSNGNPVGTRTGTRVVKSWIKVDGTIMAIGLCHWYDLAQALRMAKANKARKAVPRQIKLSPGQWAVFQPDRRVLRRTLPNERWPDGRPMYSGWVFQ